MAFIKVNLYNGCKIPLHYTSKWLCKQRGVRGWSTGPIDRIQQQASLKRQKEIGFFVPAKKRWEIN